MNPFSRFLSQWLRRRDPNLEAFIARWDAAEQLVIRIYKQDRVSEDDARVFQEAWPWLQAHYPAWEVALADHWPQTLVGGRPAPEDPFLRLLNVEAAAEFRGDWEAMQFLPAAREALNQLLVAMSE